MSANINQELMSRFSVIIGDKQYAGPDVHSAEQAIDQLTVIKNMPNRPIWLYVIMRYDK